MTTPVNVLIIIHGMSPHAEPTSPFKLYQEFWEALLKEKPELSRVFPESFIGVEWGQELPINLTIPSEQIRTDQRLTRAQNFVNERVCYDKVVKDPHPNNITQGMDFPLLTPLVRRLVVGLRESIITRGFGDVIYYSSEDGEREVRRAVYGQVLEKLELYHEAKDVRLHLIGHSLGVALTHDFLFGLFAPNHQPGFCEKDFGLDGKRFEQWRQKAQRKELKLGSLSSTASQLPMFAMRKQKLVDFLAENKLLDPSYIGIEPTNQVKWKVFYDIDDLLGFCTRRLYDAPEQIMEYQVDCGDNPGDAHNGYWKNKTVIKETADLLFSNADGHN
ncbi:hypothetical protein [Calothrix rhizosoleniae]|uniref:hypothetical protein n=1 Tax=Calothrix rhizosoleniae TaxID=888997 RepID=UPI000B49B595|nr:hypothetical protein [Calothrix rhizosoleniae]